MESLGIYAKGFLAWKVSPFRVRGGADFVQSLCEWGGVELGFIQSLREYGDGAGFIQILCERSTVWVQGHGLG